MSIITVPKTNKAQLTREKERCSYYQ